MTRTTALPCAAACALALLAAAAGAQENKAPGWYAKAIGNFAMTSGNSKANTFGFVADVNRTFIHSDVSLVGGALRQSNTKLTYAAFGTGPNGPFTVTETETTDVATEAYFVRLKGRHRFTERLAGYLGSDYERDVPAGIDMRLIGAAGVDYDFADRDNLKFTVGLGVTISSEDQVVPRGQGPNVGLVDTDSSGVGLRLSWKFMHAFGAPDEGGKPGSRLLSDLILDQDLGNTSGVRINTVNALEVAINRRFGLRAGLTLKYDNAPPVLALQPVNPSTGAIVPVELSGLPKVALEKADMVFTAGLTVNVFAAR